MFRVELAELFGQAVIVVHALGLETNFVPRVLLVSQQDKVQRYPPQTAQTHSKSSRLLTSHTADAMPMFVSGRVLKLIISLSSPTADVQP